jgi:hypothetical protein
MDSVKILLQRTCTSRSFTEHQSQQIKIIRFLSSLSVSQGNREGENHGNETFHTTGFLKTAGALTAMTALGEMPFDLLAATAQPKFPGAQWTATVNKMRCARQ